MRFRYALIAGSVVLAGAGGSASSQAPEEQPKPKRFGINPEIVVQPVEPAAEEPQSRKSGVDTGTVVQVDQPGAQTAPGTARNPRYSTVMRLVPGSEPCPGFKYSSPTRPVIIEPAIKGRGFYLPLHQFTNAFPGPITLQNSADNFTELGHPMSFQGLIAVRDVTSGLVDGYLKIEVKNVQGWGQFSGNLLRDASRFSVNFEVDWVSQGKDCSMTGSLAGELVRR